ncbi:MAG: DUF3108 domain-containing protein [Sulfuricurvum sp.]
MSRIVWIVLLCAPMLFSKTLSATYEVSFGIFQKLGVAETTLQINDDQTYRIRVEAKTTGWAKTLSNNRTELYESRGIVRNGRLIPSVYTTMRKSNSKMSLKTYTFDHANRVVWKETLKTTADGEENRNRETNEYYASEDILSLFFNLKLYTIKRQSTYFNAIGGNKEDGRIDTIFPRNEALAKMKQELQLEDGEFLKVILNERIFSSEKGELMINLDDDGLCRKAVLKDVLLFGDIVGTRIR